MPQAARNTGSTDAASPAQSRVTVALPREVADLLDKVGKLIEAQVFSAARVHVSMSKPDVIHSIAKTAHEVMTSPPAEA